MYNHWRYARRIDADNLGIYHNDGTKMLNIDKGTANLTIIGGGVTTGDDIQLKCNTVNDYPYIKLLGDSAIDLRTKNFVRIYKELVEQFRFDTGAMFLKETTTPTAITDFGALYCKADNKLYFQDGAGAEHTVTIV